MEELEAMTGVVENIIYSSPDGAFSVFRFKPEGQHSTVTVTVQTTAPLQGQQLELKGQWIEHPRFGSQFKALHMVISAPTSPQGIERFLASGVIEGVGKAMAARIVAVFGGQTLEIIENSPIACGRCEALGPKQQKKSMLLIRKRLSCGR